MGDIIGIERDLLKSAAFRSLGSASILVLLDFLGKRQFTKIKQPGSRKKAWIVKNNGELVYTYDEAESNGITRPRFARALSELILRGFLDVTHAGQAGWKGDVSTYSISDRWQKYGTSSFEEKTREKYSRPNTGFKLYWKKRRHKQK